MTSPSVPASQAGNHAFAGPWRRVARRPTHIQRRSLDACRLLAAAPTSEARNTLHFPLRRLPRAGKARSSSTHRRSRSVWQDCRRQRMSRQRGTCSDTACEVFQFGDPLLGHENAGRADTTRLLCYSSARRRTAKPARARKRARPPRRAAALRAVLSTTTRAVQRAPQVETFRLGASGAPFASNDYCFHTARVLRGTPPSSERPNSAGFPGQIPINDARWLEGASSSAARTTGA